MGSERIRYPIEGVEVQMDLCHGEHQEKLSSEMKSMLVTLDLVQGSSNILLV